MSVLLLFSRQVDQKQLEIFHDQTVNNVAQNFGAAQVMTTTSDVDVDRITERLDREVALTKMHRLQTQSHCDGAH